MRRLAFPLAVLFIAALAFAHVPDDPAAHGGVLLVTNKSENTLSFIDTDTGEELERIATGPGPHEVATTPDGRLAFVANYGSNSLTVVDVAKREALGMIDLGEHTRPHGIVVSKDGSSVWATTEGSQDLVEVDVESRTVKRAIKTAYTANIGSGNVTAVDIERGEVIKQIATGAGAEGIAVTIDDRYVLVTNREAGTFSVIDVSTDEIVHDMEVGGFPIRVEVTPDGKHALVSQATAATLTEIEIGSWVVTRKLEVGAMPVGVEIRPDGKVAYVANTRDDMLTAVDLEKFEALMTMKGGDEPDGMAYVAAEAHQ